MKNWRVFDIWAILKYSPVQPISSFPDSNGFVLPSHQVQMSSKINELTVTIDIFTQWFCGLVFVMKCGM